MSRSSSPTAIAAALCLLLAPAPWASAEAQETEAPAPGRGAPEDRPRAGPPGWAGERMMGQPGRGMRGEAHGRQRDRRGASEVMGPMMGHSMMGHPMMGHGLMMRMMFALADADGDGSLSREEFLDAHERIFNHMDADGDGQLTMEEMRSFLTGRRPAATLDDTPQPDPDNDE